MTREEVLNSIALKKRFCKDCNLPIVVFDNPYFYERLQTIDRLFGCIESFNTFCAELEQYANEQEYFAYYNEVKDGIIDFIKSQADFGRFMEESFKVETTYQKRNLYIEDNDNKTFISIDMKKANFSALRHYAPSIFGFANTWEQFVGMFTTNAHIINSKYIRQVVLGACNPKRQIQYERFLMTKLLNHMVSYCPDLNVFSLGEDEILLEVGDNCKFSLKALQEIIFNCPEGVGSLVRGEMFDLDKIDGVTGWTKHHYSFGAFPDDTEKVDFKCVDAEIFHQVVKHYYGEPITKNDLVFYHNGRLAKFLQEVA